MAPPATHPALFREIANGLSSPASPASPHWLAWFDTAMLPWHILRSEGYGASGPGGLFQLYEEMEQKDGHLFAVLQTRKNGVLSRPRKVVAAGDSPTDQRIARFVAQTLRRTPRFDQSLLNILDAFGKGVSVQEIVWKREGRAVVPAALKSRAPYRFLYSPDGSLRLESRPGAAPRTTADETPRTSGRTSLARTLHGEALPERKFLRFTFGALYDNPVGQGLCLRAYWYYWFKKNNVKFWMVFNEKFGTPTVVGKYQPGASQADRDRLLEVIDSIQNDTGVAVPESVTLDLLEATRSGNVSTYRELANWCNDEISKIVLGATLTASEGSRSGSLALGQVHDRVRGEYIEADARALEDAVNSQLVRWIVDFNFGIDAPAPRWTIDTTRDDALEREIQVDRELVAAGVALPESYFYDKYQRPAPIGAEPALRYDDRNLFQYHLRYGVLTINEARARLGLPPVSWGEQPARLVATQTEHAPGDSPPGAGTESVAEDAAESESESGNEDPREQ